MGLYLGSFVSVISRYARASLSKLDCVNSGSSIVLLTLMHDRSTSNSRAFIISNVMHCLTMFSQDVLSGAARPLCSVCERRFQSHALLSPGYRCRVDAQPRNCNTTLADTEIPLVSTCEPHRKGSHVCTEYSHTLVEF